MYFYIPQREKNIGEEGEIRAKKERYEKVRNLMWISNQNKAQEVIQQGFWHYSQGKHWSIASARQLNSYPFPLMAAFVGGMTN